jgi:amidase
MVVNTPAFNLTGHPSLNLPCAMREGLPVGAMLVGRAFEERTIYRAANVLERDFDWRNN